MIQKSTRFNVRTCIGWLCSTILLLAGSCTKNTDQAELPLTGTFTCDSWEIGLDNQNGTGVFTKTGLTQRQVGEEFLKINRRTGYNSWSVRVYNRTLTSKGEGTISLNDGMLTIHPNQGDSYSLFRSTSTNGNPGCAAGQCRGNTQSGRRCQRITSNCTGYCWQH